MGLEDKTEAVNVDRRQGSRGLNSGKDDKGVWEGLASEVGGDQKRACPESQVKKVKKVKKEGINHGKRCWENKSEGGWRLNIRFGNVEATADCGTYYCIRFLWRVLMIEQ